MLNTIEALMTGRIVNHLEEIRVCKEKELGVKLTWEKVANDLGIAYTTMLRWSKGQVERFDDKTLARFCEYFKVQPGDILTYEE
jgi:DNA-binding Xre family transcriptional regulator